jgi:hypothetical protein
MGRVMGARMPQSPQEARAQVMAYMRAKVGEVGSFLRAADVEGANDLMDQVVREAGTGCHDLILDAVARCYGEPSWRIAADKPEWRNTR